MDAHPLLIYAEELRRIYGLQREVDAAFSHWHRYLTSGECRPDRHMMFGDGNPNDPESSFQYWALMGDLAERAKVDGENSRRLRRMAIVFAYTSWDVETRQQIADLSGKKKCDILHPAYGDLNKLRQAVVHVNGKIDRKMEVFSFIKQGDAVDLNSNQFHELFRALTFALNDIARDYLNLTTSLKFDYQFAAPRPEENADAC